eukprot:scaffold977_cov253-Pinguiococcus_pyrenoidosus.AAC.41
MSPLAERVELPSNLVEIMPERSELQPEFHSLRDELLKQHVEGRDDEEHAHVETGLREVRTALHLARQLQMPKQLRELRVHGFSRRTRVHEGGLVEVPRALRPAIVVARDVRKAQVHEVGVAHHPIRRLASHHLLGEGRLGRRQEEPVPALDVAHGIICERHRQDLLHALLGRLVHGDDGLVDVKSEHQQRFLRLRELLRRSRGPLQQRTQSDCRKRRRSYQVGRAAVCSGEHAAALAGASPRHTSRNGCQHNGVCKGRQAQSHGSGKLPIQIGKIPKHRQNAVSRKTAAVFQASGRGEMAGTG